MSAAVPVQGMQLIKVLAIASVKYWARQLFKVRTWTVQLSSDLDKCAIQ